MADKRLIIRKDAMEYDNKFRIVSRPADFHAKVRIFEDVVEKVEESR